ncbi:hypothetical protein [Allorhodopirellula heiligendammensis]|uniref:Uncharacterized protein n=1 Tax=Allorhodopirellula heiligendammensis TaxID=2714739 RepID=A0A5C6AZM7_9BACT|nr:hypothetical protein [Allorhodopirellula heiligendammensis]TWU05413.1 hypothetical protein Poly21_56770 [Allorhodopirellula heiligendammensis]
MKSLKLAFVASALFACGIATYVHTARANPIQDAASMPARLIDFLPQGTVIDLSFSSGLTSVKILENEYIERWETETASLIRNYEAISKDQTAGKNQLAEIESSLYKVSSPWKVTAVAENYVRLEPILRLPLHENTPWIILPESSISYIKPN